MYLNELHIVNFKNISQKSFSFPKKINCFVGKNGVGKTNILDAIYYLSQGKSYFNNVALQNIKHHEDFFLLDGHFTKNDSIEHIVCSIKKGHKKNLKRNGKVYTKFSEHIGLIPLVIISPADQDLILEGSETRRKFIDAVISQQDNRYLQDLIAYQKIVLQRNSLLKNFYLSNTFDPSTLEIYNQQLIPLAENIHKKRSLFIEEFSNVFLDYYQQISGNHEQVSIRYESALHTDSMNDLLITNLHKDRVLQYTSQGIHKDDLLLEINGYPIKKFGSQGQQKSFLIALKLAQFDFLKKQSGILPILLFDDIFDKLDSSRVQQIIQMVNQERFGQLFITDTHIERTKQIVESTGLDYEIFEITKT